MADPEIYNQLASLRARVDAIDHKQEILIRAQRKEIERAITEAMQDDPSLAAVYLMVDGQRTQKAVVEALKEIGATLSQPTVSRKMDILEGELAIIEPSARTKEGVVFRKSALDRILRLTPKVERLWKTKGRSSD